MKRKFIGLIVSVLLPFFASAEEADMVLLGGRIYTVNEELPWANAVAIKGDQFVFVGDDDNAKKYIGKNTKVLSLEGRMVMPGLHDAHSHLLLTGLQNLYECKLGEGISLAEIMATLKECEKNLAPGDWLVGGLVDYTQFPNNTFHRAPLDEAFPDRPVYLTDVALHNAVINARALKLAGVNRNTPEPNGGKIVKDKNGEPTGVLIENATWLAKKHFQRSDESDKKAVLWAVRQYYRAGVTSVQEASANYRVLNALRSIDAEGQLKLDVTAHIIYGSQSFGWGENIELRTLIDSRARFDSSNVHTNAIKIWLDGGPLPPFFTSATMDRATGEVEFQDLLFSPKELETLVAEFDAKGMKVKIHCAGLGAAHVAINAIEAARKNNPNSRVRHEIAHSNAITQADMKRMQALNIVADVSPTLWHVVKLLGDPPERAWRFHSLLSHGVLTTMGTDWVVTPTINIFAALQGMLQHGEESISLSEGIRTMTINGAIALGRAAKEGSINSGKLANLIVIDRNLFEVAEDEIGKANVLLTISRGTVVFFDSEKLDVSYNQIF